MPDQSLASRIHAASGFTLVETLTALSVLVTVVLGLGQLVSLATRANERARSSIYTAVLAAEQLDRLRGLRWGFDAAGSRLSDTTTDLSVTPDAAGGAGLAPSPSDALARNVAGYCDFVDSAGRWLAGGTVPPPGAAYVRRWSIEPLAGHPLDGRVLQVRVLPIEAFESSAPVAIGESRVMSVRVRTVY